MTGLLASVTDADEARAAMAAGADIIDLKDPARGALGAVDAATARMAVAAVAGRRPVSATVGDLPMDPGVLGAGVDAVAAWGVDYIKVGLFEDEARQRAAVRALAGRAARTRLVGVMMADHHPQLDMVDALAAAGFAGAMVDTADKAGGGLRAHLDTAWLTAFVDRARGAGLLVGLAGSLTADDAAPLAALGPDYLGFRGALCRGNRVARLDATAIAEVRTRLAGPPVGLSA